MGVGAIGRSVARICKTGFQMRVLGFSRTKRGDPNVDAYVERADLNSAVAEADFVCLAMPATPQTEGIVDADAIAAMKSTAYLINVARGSIVDEAALVDALKAGRIAGAALDVLTEEPASEVNPFWDLPDVIITPHNSPMTDPNRWRLPGILSRKRSPVRRRRAAHGPCRQRGGLLTRTVRGGPDSPGSPTRPYDFVPIGP